MTFGRWLLVHSFSIFLVVLFILGYIYRDELQLEQAYQQLLNKVPQSENAQVAEQPSEVDTPAPAQVSAPQETVTPEQIVTETDVSASTEVPQDSLDYLLSTPTVSKTIIELDELLFKARKAYWDKDYQTAIFHYQQLIEDDGDNPDYIGELGNIYYSINDFDNAAQLYYQAAIILIAKNRPDQARLLVSPVTAMNRDLGDELRRRLMQSGGVRP